MNASVLKIFIMMGHEQNLKALTDLKLLKYLFQKKTYLFIARMKHIFFNLHPLMMEVIKK